jgi:hypothetical protein
MPRFARRKNSGNWRKKIFPEARSFTNGKDNHWLEAYRRFRAFTGRSLRLRKLQSAK